MNYEKYDKKLAELNLRINLRELSTKHAKELNKLEEDLATKNMLNQGPGLRALSEFLEKKLRENLDIRLKCITESFYDNVHVDEAAEENIRNMLVRYLQNEEHGLMSLYSSRIRRGRLPEGAQKSALNGIKSIIGKNKTDVFDRLKLEILKHNKSISANSSVKPTRQDVYVSEIRIQELRNVTNNRFDLKKLIRLCEELNIAHINECYLSIIMLVRSILDHVPPIFNKASFKEVANNYKFEGSSSRSFRASMQNLENSSRNIADSHLHGQVKKKMTLPSFQQVNFIADLDVLLSEVYIILSSEEHK